MNPSGDPLAEVLIDAGVITREQLDTAYSARSSNGVERLDEIMSRLGLAREARSTPPSPAASASSTCPR